MIMNPKIKLMMKIDFQHADAPSALFDFSAILNKCFYTYISCFLLQFKCIKSGDIYRLFLVIN